MAKKRGPKYKQGVAKKKILLIALNYLDGINERTLIEKINNTLPIEIKPKLIKQHLNDNGPGRIEDKELKEGKHYLIKTPSKFDDIPTKKELIKILERRGEEIDIKNLPPENIWKPNPDFEIFRNMAEEFLTDKDHIASFMQTEYTKSMICENGFPLLEQAFNIDLSKDTEAVEIVKEIILKYPAPFLILLSKHPERLEMGGLTDAERLKTFAFMVEPLFSPFLKFLMNRIDNELIIANYYLSITAFTKFVGLYPDSMLPSDNDIGRLFETNIKSLSKALTPEVAEKIPELLEEIGQTFIELSKEKNGES